MRFLEFFQRLFRRPGRQKMDPALLKMVQMIAATGENEIACDQVYAVLDQFAEAVQRGENVLTFMPLVRQHLEMCPDCREEYETLLRMLQPA
ncbi:MAG TPA: hypothetical protein VF784_00415 [Anaerolineales bacterium]